MSNLYTKVTIAALEGEADDNLLAKWLSEGSVPPEAYKHIIARGDFAITHILQDANTPVETLWLIRKNLDRYTNLILIHPNITRELADDIIYNKNEASFMQRGSVGYLDENDTPLGKCRGVLAMVATNNMNVPYETLQSVLSYEGVEDHEIHRSAKLALAKLAKAEEDERIAEEQREADKHYDSEVEDIEAKYEARCTELREAAAWTGE